MKILQKNLYSPASGKRHSKSSNKSRGTKKAVEKTFKDAFLNDSREISPRQNIPKDALKKARVNHHLLPPEVSIILEDNVKKTKLDKRKQEGSEWKALKKVDYQRLETVMEEGQLSSEETSSKHNFPESRKSDSGSDTDQAVLVAPDKYKKSWICSLISLAEPAEAPKPEEHPPENPSKLQGLQHQQCPPLKFQPEQPIRYQPYSEKKLIPSADVRGNLIEIGQFRREPTEALAKELGQGKRNVILSGMMEILPIFSNDKFVCSRDAISIEEYEDMEMDKLDRNRTSSGKTLLEAKSVKDSRAIDIKPFISANCMKERRLDGRFMEGVGDCKEVVKRKPRFQVLTDRNVCQKTSSPFIDSLLVLTPFCGERERIMRKGKGLKESVEDIFYTANDFSSDLEGEEKGRLSLKVCFGVVMTTLCLLMMFLIIAWKSYKPPCFVDSIIEVLPFTHHRRSYAHRVLDKLMKFLSSLIGGLCLSCCSPNQISELPVF